MSFTSERASFWDGLRRLPSRTPLRVKMITALLALVFIALMTISVAGLLAFQSDLRTQAANQVTNTFNARVSQLTARQVFSVRAAACARTILACTGQSWWNCSTHMGR